MTEYRRLCRPAPALLLLGMTIAVPTAHSAEACSPTVTNVSETARRLIVTSDCGTTVIEPWGPSLVHVQHMPAQPAKSLPPSLIVIASQPDVPFKVDRSDETNIVASLPRLRLIIARKDGRLRFEQADGKLQLEDNGARFAPS